MATELKSANNLADQATAVAVKQLESGVEMKRNRIAEIQKSENLYFHKTEKALKGRFNVPLPIMSGFVEALKAKIDDPVRIKFTQTEEADGKKARKVSAAWDLESGPTRGDWDRKDLDAKYLSIFSGIGIMKYSTEKDPKYKSTLEVIDYVDFVCDAPAGPDLENHMYAGQMHIMRTKEDLLDGVKKGFYNNEQVQKLINMTSDEDLRRNTKISDIKNNRLSAMGIDVESNSFVGNNVFDLTEWCMVYQGDRYYVLFDYASGVWVRFEKLTAVFSSGLYPFRAWHTHRDPKNFWSKAPTDDMRPVCEAMHILFNQALDNRQKRNFGQRAYDTEIFKNPEKLEWRPDGLVPVTLKPGKNLQGGIYEFHTEDMTGTIDMIQYLDNMLGQKTGVTASAEGATDKDAKVGIYYGDMKQVADRMGLYNKAYSAFWADLGKLFYEGLKQNMTEDIMVKMIGENGVEWDTLNKEDVKPEKDFDIEIYGGNAKAEEESVTKQTKSAALNDILALGGGAFGALLNPKWVVEQKLETGGYEPEEIRVAMDTLNYGEREIIEEAAQENIDILAGRPVKPNRGATSGHLKKHLDFAMDEDIPLDKVQAIMAHFEAEAPLAMQNEALKAKALVQQQMLQGGAGSETAPMPTAPMNTQPALMA